MRSPYDPNIHEFSSGNHLEHNESTTPLGDLYTALKNEENLQAEDEHIADDTDVADDNADEVPTEAFDDEIEDETFEQEDDEVCDEDELSNEDYEDEAYPYQSENEMLSWDMLADIPRHRLVFIPYALVLIIFAAQWGTYYNKTIREITIESKVLEDLKHKHLHTIATLTELEQVDRITRRAEELRLPLVHSTTPPCIIIDTLQYNP